MVVFFVEQFNNQNMRYIPLKSFIRSQNDIRKKIHLYKTVETKIFGLSMSASLGR